MFIHIYFLREHPAFSRSKSVWKIALAPTLLLLVSDQDAIAVYAYLFNIHWGYLYFIGSLNGYSLSAPFLVGSYVSSSSMNDEDLKQLYQKDFWQLLKVFLPVLDVHHLTTKCTSVRPLFIECTMYKCKTYWFLKITDKTYEELMRFHFLQEQFSNKQQDFRVALDTSMMHGRAANQSFVINDDAQMTKSVSSSSTYGTFLSFYHWWGLFVWR